MSQANQPAEKKRKQICLSSNSDDSEDDPKMNREVLEKSLTNLQINMRELNEKINFMMQTFNSFCEEFKVDHKGVEEEFKRFKDQARKLIDKINDKDKIDNSKISSNEKRLQTVLTKLQLQMKALAAKMEDMIISLEKCIDQAQVNHMVIREQMNFLTEEAENIAEQMNSDM